MKRIRSYIICIISAVMLICSTAYTAVYADETPLSSQEYLASSSDKAKDIAALRKRIASALDGYKSKISVTDIHLSADEMIIVFNEVISDRKYFYAYDISFYVDNKDTPHEMCFDYMCTKENVSKYQKKYNDALDNILKNVDETWTDLQKVIYIHDRIVTTSTYRADKSLDHSAYYILVNHIGCCTGYSVAFATLLNELDIETAIVVNADHMWNMVKLNGKWYNVDCTADDPAVNGNYQTLTDNCFHDSFLLSTSSLSSDMHSKPVSFHSATDRYYENFKWDKTIKPMSMYGKCIIYSDENGNVKSYDQKNNKITTLASKKDSWIVWSTYTRTSTYEQYSYEDRSFISTVRYKNTLYFNTSKTVYSYDLKTGKQTKIKTIDPRKNDNMNIYGLTVSGGKLYAYTAVDSAHADKRALIKELAA